MNDDDIDDDDLEALQKRMVPPGEEPGIDFDDDDEYAQIMGKAKSKSKSKGNTRQPVPRQSVSNLIKERTMEKAGSSMRSKNRGGGMSG